VILCKGEKGPKEASRGGAKAKGQGSVKGREGRTLSSGTRWKTIQPGNKNERETSGPGLRLGKGGEKPFLVTIAFP